MECELCYNGYDSTHTVPKILKTCAHTYCNTCLTFQKQRDGMLTCYTCRYESKTYLNENNSMNKLSINSRARQNVLTPSQQISLSQQQQQLQLNNNLNSINSINGNNNLFHSQQQQQSHNANQLVQNSNNNANNSILFMSIDNKQLQNHNSIDNPDSLPINQSLLKLIEFRRNERFAIQKMKNYLIENPSRQFIGSVEETISRPIRPFQLHLSEITQDELIYKELIENPYLDKRTLGNQMYPYRTYVFNHNSLFMNYFFMNERTRLLFLFRRLNGCQHKHSCVESTLRKVFDVFSFYSVLRIPLHALMGALSSKNENNDINNNIMDSKWFIGIEIGMLLLIGGLRSAGCFVRFMNEEIIQQS